MEGLQVEVILSSVADIIKAEDVKIFGKELGLERKEIKGYKKRKKVVGKRKYKPKGTNKMLVEWAKGKEDVVIMDELREALERAELPQVVELCLSEAAVGDQSADETDEELGTSSDHGPWSDNDKVLAISSLNYYSLPCCSPLNYVKIFIHKYSMCLYEFCRCSEIRLRLHQKADPLFIQIP